MAILAPADDRETLVVGGDSNEQGSEQDSVPGIDHGTHGSSNYSANPQTSENESSRQALPRSSLFPSVISPNMSTMGGGRFDPTKAQWQKAFCVLPDGNVAVDHDEKIRGLPSYGLDTEHSEPQMHRIGRLSLASGNIYVDVIVLSDQGILIKTVSLSGFFLNGDKFVTSGHLLDVEEGTDTQQTIDHLSSSTVDSPRAFVSIRFKTESSSDASSSWPVYLIHIDRSADIAVFALAPGVSNRQGYPPHTLVGHQIGSIYDNTDAGNIVEEKNLFAAYYPGYPKDVDRESLSKEARELVRAKEEQRKRVFENQWDMITFVSQPSGVPDSLPFHHIFQHGWRSVAFGRIVPGPELELARGKKSDFAHGRECTIIGTWGCSGGMVCQFKAVGVAIEAQVIGLFYGESPEKPYNRVAVFTPEGVEKLRQLCDQTV